uniref:PAS domain-containing protein n=1 Tax=Rhabditophanes sp. KR3021 TaxID=114890 RepID=A0AC35UBW0_9BILA
MSLACIFIRKQKYLSHVSRQFDPQSHTYYMAQQQPLNCMLRGPPSPPRIQETSKALKGFLVMITRSGKLLYISENASEYLGHSVEEIMCQGDSLYDLIDSRDHGAVQSELLSGPPSLNASPYPEDKVFLCRINLSRTAKRHLQYHKFVLIQGRYMHPQEYYDNALALAQPYDVIQPIFAAYCHPLINPENADILANGSTHIFRAIHHMDLSFSDLDYIGMTHLELNYNQIPLTSFYNLIHQEDLMAVANSHRTLSVDKEGSTICLFRLQKKTGDFIWVHGVFIVKSSCPPGPDQEPDLRIKHMIHATYQVLNELEANTLRVNTWIYSIKHHIPKELCYIKDSDHQLPSPSDIDIPPSPKFISPPIESQPHHQQPPLLYNIQPPRAIKVEIPVHPKYGVDMYHGLINHNIPPNLLTPEHSSPDSSCSYTSLNINNGRGHGFDRIQGGMYSERMAEDSLPELGDDLDEFFKQVESFPSPESHSSKVSRDNCESRLSNQSEPTPNICSPLRAPKREAAQCYLDDEWWKNNKIPPKMDRKCNTFYKQRHSIQIGTVDAIHYPLHHTLNNQFSIANCKLATTTQHHTQDPYWQQRNQRRLSGWNDM